MKATDADAAPVPPLRLRGEEPEPEALLHAMRTVRAIETALMDAYTDGRFKGPLHVSLGQEAVAVGIAATMDARDVLVSNHRGHGHALAFGLDPARVVAEVVCDPCGYAGGRGGSMHIFAPEQGFLGTNGIVGDGAGLGLGAALALHAQGTGGVAVSVFGDGAMGTGIVYEAMNMAALWNLPVVFVCENNGYAEMTPTSVHLSTEPHGRAEAFGLETLRADGDDVAAVRDALASAAAHARAGRPAFVELATHRWTGHYVGDPGLYRPEGEAERWRAEHCPIRRLRGDAEPGAEEAARDRALAEAAAALVDEVLNHDHSDPGSQGRETR